MNESITIPAQTVKKKVKSLTIHGYTENVKKNLKKQQREYRRLTGKNIRLDYLATILLKTATYKPEEI